jgi:hypothetical protein
MACRHVHACVMHVHTVHTAAAGSRACNIDDIVAPVQLQGPIRCTPSAAAAAPSHVATHQQPQIRLHPTGLRTQQLHIAGATGMATGHLAQPLQRPLLHTGCQLLHTSCG